MALDELKDLFDLGYRVEDMQRRAKTTDTEEEFAEWYEAWAKAAREK